MEYILRHGPGNPRNSEGSFVQLADGTIYFAYTRYNGESGHDHASADIAFVTSRDRGASWSKPVILRKNRALNLMSVSLLRLQDGRIAMTYLEKSAVPGWAGFVDCRPKIMFSGDEARTWSAPREITHVPPAYFVVNNDRLIQLANGRLILPAAHHPYGNHGLEAGCIRFFISDDAGESWQIGPRTLYPAPGMRRGLMEPGLLELTDHTLMCFIRTGDGCQYKAFSRDGGESWSPPEPAGEFLSPESPMSIKRHGKTGKLYAVWNDWHPLRKVQPLAPKWERTPLVIAESTDEGATWQDHRVLENAPDHGYCYTAMYFTESDLYLGYCCGGLPECSGVLQETKLRKIPLA